MNTLLILKSRSPKINLYLDSASSLVFMLYKKNKSTCNKVCEAVRRRTVMNGNDEMNGRDLDNRLVQIS